MPGPARVKICGVAEPAAIDAAAAAGAAYLGFVFFPPSPRALTAEEARPLLLSVPAGIAKVALTVDADDATLDTVAALPIDIVQLHGRESPTRVAEVKARTGLPVIKAIGVREPADLDVLRAFADVADQFLIDAKPPAGVTLPGGNGLAFDWRMLEGRRIPRPWLLAGGLTPENAAEARARTGAMQLDVSSGVEARPGVKDPARIAAFLEAARTPLL